MSRQRGSLRLMREILIKGDCNSTSAREMPDTRRKSTRECLVLLWESGMLERTRSPDRRAYYHTTMSGRKVLRTIEEVIDILNTNSSISV